MIQTPLPVVSDTSEAARFHPISNLMLALTDRCNLRCTYCFVEKTRRRMSSETARQAVDFFLHRNISGVRPQVNITFFGGEPLIELDLMEEVVQYARTAPRCCRKQIGFAATTNGTLAGPRVEKLIRDSGMRLLVSLDGPPVANRFRTFEHGGDSHALVARNLLRLVSWSPQVVVRMTYHPAALWLAESARHLLDLGAPSVAIAPVVESDWSGCEDALREAHEQLADWFIQEARLGRLLPLEGTWILLKRLDQARLGLGRPTRNCGVAHELLGIDPEGNVMPCHRFLYRPADWLGRVETPRLEGARNAYLDYDSRRIAGCQDCSARDVCAGGCRAVALEAGLGLQGAHPGHCLITRAQTAATRRIYETLVTEANQGFLTLLRSRQNLGPALRELALN